MITIYSFMKFVGGRGKDQVYKLLNKEAAFAFQTVLTKENIWKIHFVLCKSGRKNSIKAYGRQILAEYQEYFIVGAGMAH